MRVAVRLLSDGFACRLAGFSFGFFLVFFLFFSFDLFGFRVPFRQAILSAFSASLGAGLRGLCVELFSAAFASNLVAVPAYCFFPRGRSSGISASCHAFTAMIVAASATSRGTTALKSSTCEWCVQL